MWWARTASVGIALIPAAIYYYSGQLSGDVTFRKYEPIIWGLSIIFIISIVSTDMLFTSLYHYSWGFYPEYVITSIPFLLYFFGVLIEVVRQQIQAKSVLMLFLSDTSRLLITLLPGVFRSIHSATFQFSFLSYSQAVR